MSARVFLPDEGWVDKPTPSPASLRESLQGTWTITQSTAFEGLGVTISGTRVIWANSRYAEEPLISRGASWYINTNLLVAVDSTSATWKNEDTGETLVWRRA